MLSKTRRGFQASNQSFSSHICTCDHAQKGMVIGTGAEVNITALWEMDDGMNLDQANGLAHQCFHYLITLLGDGVNWKVGSEEKK